MKKLYYLLLTALLLLVNTADVLASGKPVLRLGFFEWLRNFFSHIFSDVPSDTAGTISDGGAIGAPLDGGLLALLAAAGFGYFAMRRKKKNIKE